MCAEFEATNVEQRISYFDEVEGVFLQRIPQDSVKLSPDCNQNLELGW